MRVLTLLLVVAAVAGALSLPADRVTREGAACTSEVYAYTGQALSAGQYVTIGSATSYTISVCGHDFTTLYSECVVSSSCGPTGAGTITIYGTDLSGDYHVTAVNNGCITMCRCP